MDWLDRVFNEVDAGHIDPEDALCWTQRAVQVFPVVEVAHVARPLAQHGYELLDQGEIERGRYAIRLATAATEWAGARVGAQSALAGCA